MGYNSPILKDKVRAMTLETARLILRPWQETDAEILYEYAKNPSIGPMAGWPPHTDVENSRQIIRDVLIAEENYAVTLKENPNAAIGSLGLMIGERSNLNIAPGEGEIGYWIAEPFWGRGLIPEGVRALIHRAFEDLGLTTLWCGYFDGNEKSARVGEKCGFTYHHTEYDKQWPLINAVKNQHVTRLTKEEWQKSL